MAFIREIKKILIYFLFLKAIYFYINLQIKINAFCGIVLLILQILSLLITEKKSFIHENQSHITFKIMNYGRRF